MIHAFSMYGTNIVLDVNSGFVHVFDDIAYNVVSFFDAEGNFNKDEIVESLKGKYSVRLIEEAVDEIERLKKKGQLFSEDIFKPHFEKWNRDFVLKALCLHIAHDCNLRCGYCFAKTGEYRGKREMMSFEVGKQAIDFLIASSGKRQNLEIDFFGGEPLMNFEVVKDIVFYAKSIEADYNKNFRFTITTNAMLLDDDKIKFINDNMYNIVLSIDGRKAINDRMRKKANGTGCYEDILPLICKTVDLRRDKNYYVRGTFTRYNLDFTKDVLHLADLGFKEISVEPVVADENLDYSIRQEDIPAIIEEYEKLASEYVKRKSEGREFHFFHFMLDLYGGPCVAKRLRGCGSGTEYLAVAPNGDIYPCHQFVGIEAFKLGTVFEGIKNDSVVSQFKDVNVYTKPECDKCWAKFFCSGGCIANSWSFHNDLKHPYEIGCEMQKKRIECALWIQSVLQTNAG